MSKKLLFFVLILFCTHAALANEQMRHSNTTYPHENLKNTNEIAKSIFEKTQPQNDIKNVPEKNTNNHNSTKTIEIKYTPEEEENAFSDYIIGECAREANSALLELRRNQYTEDKKNEINKAAARLWQMSFMSFFAYDNDLISWKEKLENLVESKRMALEQYAKIAANVRLAVSTYTGIKNEIKLNIPTKEVSKEGDNVRKSNFEKLLNEQLEKQKKIHETKKTGEKFTPDLNKAYKAIIEASTKINPIASTIHNCYDFFPRILCDCAGGLLGRFTKI